MDNGIARPFIHSEIRGRGYQLVARTIPKYYRDLKLPRDFYEIVKDLKSPVERPNIAILIVFVSAENVCCVEEEILSIFFRDVSVDEALYVLFDSD